MSEASSIDLAQASHVMDLQNGSNSLVTSPSVGHEQASPTPLSSPDSGGGETVDYIHSPSVIPVMSPYGGMVVMMPSSAEGSTDQVSSPSPPQETNILTLLRTQLEYYFSKDNLATDKYLLSQMDGDHFVPVSVLANFNQVKRLSSDMNLIIEAIKDSGSLRLDPTGTKVKAIPEKRCILILREIPKETPKEDVFQLFSGENCPNFLSCYFAENDCWYVTFSDEHEAQEAYRYLREEVRDFLGKPIRARIKNTTVQRATSLPKPRPQFSYSSVQPVPFYQQAPVVWPPPYYSAEPYAAPYINGFPSHSGFSAGGGGPSSQNASRFVLSNSTSLPGTSSVSGSGGNVTRDVNARKSSTSSSSSGKSRHAISNDIIAERRSGSTGSGHFSGAGRDGRFRRNDDDRDRTRNLPNRFRNKRNEEATIGTDKDDKSEKPVEKEKPVNERSNNRQRFQHRTQPKLDFAPTNFPPLPGQTDASPIPPPPPLPPISPEANLADIVKGRYALPLPVTAPATNVTEIKPVVSSTKLSQSKPLSTSVSTTTTATAKTGGGTMPVSIVTTVVQSSKFDTKVSSRVNEKESSSIVKHNVHVSRSPQVVRNQNSNGGRNRYRDSRESRKFSSNSSRPSSQRQSPKPTKTASSVPPPPPTCNEVGETVSEEKADEPPKLEKMSYAQMAGQKKSKRSSSTSDVVPATSSTSPPISPNQASSESNTPSPVSPPPPPFQSEPTSLS